MNLYNISDTSILQDERLPIDSPDLGDNKTAFANPNKDKYRKSDHDRRFQYSRSKAKCLIRQFEILTATDRIPCHSQNETGNPEKSGSKGQHCFISSEQLCDAVLKCAHTTRRQ